MAACTPLANRSDRINAGLCRVSGLWLQLSLYWLRDLMHRMLVLLLQQSLLAARSDASYARAIAAAIAIGCAI